MELPEAMTTIGFWVKFVPIFFVFVIVPIFFLNFTGELSLIKKILFMIAGGIGLTLALLGKSINLHRRK